MRRFLNTLFFTVLLAAIAGAGIFAGYTAVTGTDRETEVVTFSAGGHSGRYAPQGAHTEPLIQAETYAETFLPGAVLRFEYHYRSGERADSWEMDMPPALIGGSIYDLTAIFPGWYVSEHSQTGAALRHELPGPPGQSFLVNATAEGYVAVFFDDPIDGSKLKEVTDTSLSRLPPAERERLIAGILVQSEDVLMRLLEDLGS